MQESQLGILFVPPHRRQKKDRRILCSRNRGTHEKKQPETALPKNPADKPPTPRRHPSRNFSIALMIADISEPCPELSPADARRHPADTPIHRKHLFPWTPDTLGNTSFLGHHKRFRLFRHQPIKWWERVTQGLLLSCEPIHHNECQIIMQANNEPVLKKTRQI